MTPRLCVHQRCLFLAADVYIQLPVRISPCLVSVRTHCAQDCTDFPSPNLTFLSLFPIQVNRRSLHLVAQLGSGSCLDSSLPYPAFVLSDTHFFLFDLLEWLSHCPTLVSTVCQPQAIILYLTKAAAPCSSMSKLALF